MSFQFNSDSDQSTYNDLTSLIKKNNGLFRTWKQANFLFSVYKKLREFDTKESVQNFFGITLEDGQHLVDVSASTRWAEYGARSYRPVCWMFVVDKYGIVAQYKLGYVGSSDTGTAPDPKKTKLLWNRTCEVKELEPPVEQVVAPSEYVSHIGRRIEMVGVVKKIRAYTKPKFHYYDSDIGYMTQIMVGSNVVIYWGSFPDVKETDMIKFRATIKDHSIRDGVRQTTVNRPVLIKEAEQITNQPETV